MLCLLYGCVGEPRPTKDLADFQDAGPIWPMAELKSLARPGDLAEPYRITPGDVLELQLTPAMMSTSGSTQDQDAVTPYLCRVSQQGTIALPVLGEVPLAGRTLTEAEEVLADAYCPRYLLQRPATLVRVKDYHTVPISISGAVNKPGAYELRSNEMTLLALLMKAGGVVKEGAGTIRVQFADTEDLVLPVYCSFFPPADVPLKAGEAVLVEQDEPRNFAVVGLVRNPGAFPYPPNVRYNLMQAVAMAGGVNDLADPRFATVYRRRGENVAAGVFKICGKEKVCAAGVEIKPGDVIALEHTPRTRARMILAEVFRMGAAMNIGANITAPVP